MNVTDFLTQFSPQARRGCNHFYLTKARNSCLFPALND